VEDPEFVVRNYHGEDREQIVALWRVVFAGDPRRNEPNSVIDRKLSIENGLFFVLVARDIRVANAAGAQVVGTVLAGFDGVRGWVYHLAVMPELRRQGLAGRLMDHAEERLRARGCSKLNLQVRTSNAEVVAFYESRGTQSIRSFRWGRFLARRDSPGSRMAK
jgi:ribosomal protein S18 acetylase RimI-like enzyme